MATSLTSTTSSFSLNTWRLFCHQAWLWLFLCILAATPWFFWPPSPVAYEVPRVFFWLAGIELLLVMCCGWASISVLQGREFFRLNWPMVIATVGWLTISIASSAYNQVLVQSLVGNYFRIDGLLTFIHLWLLAIMLGLLWPHHSRYKLWFVRVVAISTAGISSWAVATTSWSWLLMGPTNHWPKAASLSFGNPNLLAGFLLMTVPCWWFWWQTTTGDQTKVRRGIIFGTAITCLALLTTQASSAIAGLALGALIIYFLQTPRQHTIGLAIVSSVVAIIGFWGVAYYQGARHFEAESRYRIAHKLSLAIADKPWLGWGWSRVSSAFEAHPWPQPILHDVYVDKAHSHFWEVLTTTGVLGLAAYGCVLGLHVWIISRRIAAAPTVLERNWLTMWLLVLLLFVYHSQTNVVGIQEELFFWLSLGMVSLPKPN